MALSMNTSPPQAGKREPAAREARIRWLLILAGAALWFIPVNQLHVEWSINPQYAYGWAVPLLALYLFGERWKGRPPPQPGRHGPVLAALALLAGFCLLPARLVQEAAPDWRLIGWVLAATVVA